MAYSLYDATVVMAKSALTSLSRMLTEAEKHPQSATFFTARLYEDMKPLTFQVHYAAFQAEALAAKLSGREDYAEPPGGGDDLDSYEKMHARISHAIKELEAANKDTANRLGETNTLLPLHGEEREFPVKAVVSKLNMPNIYFHVSMTYAILRKEGVPLGKRDWSRAFVSDYVG